MAKILAVGWVFNKSAATSGRSSGEVEIVCLFILIFLAKLMNVQQKRQPKLTVAFLIKF
jgi:hypothetical protein